MKSCHKIEQKHSESNIFTFYGTENILMKNENEASIPEFSS